MNVQEFIQGQKDCKEGNPAPRDASEHYLQGYSFQYHLEQAQGAKHESR